MDLQQQRWSGPGSRLAAVVMAAVLLVPAAVRADNAAPIAGSANLVPASAAFYTAMLRNREQIEAVLHSRAWATLHSLPAVKELIAKAHEEMAKNGAHNHVRAFLQQPENRQLLDLLKQMGSDEIFIYGGESWIGTFHLLSELNSFSTQLGMMGPNANPKAMQQTIVRALIKHRDQIRIPSLVFGFKVNGHQEAEAQLQRLEGLLKAVANQQPMLKGRIRRATVGGSPFLTINLDGSLIPWDRIPFADYEEEPGQGDELVKKLKATPLVIALGVRDNYVLLSVGPSTDPVSRLGQGPSVMQRSEMKPIEKFAGKPITSVGYVSKAFLSAISTNKKDIDNMVSAGQNALKGLPLPEDQVKQMSADLNELGNDIKRYIPEAGAQTSVSFMTNDGQESYSYDYGQSLSLDGSKPLTLLNHVGGNPILAVVARTKYDAGKYHLLVKWAKKINAYLDNFVVANLGEEQKAKYDEVTKVLFPLLKRFNEATENLVLPAFRNGQFAFVLDAGIRSNQWVQNFRTPQALPMLEPALVFGISDAAKLRQGFAEYRTILNDAIAKARDIAPAPIPEFEIPPPETRAIPNGTLYYYNLPPQISVDPQLLPNASLSSRILALTISPKQSERLLSPIPLKVQHGPLTEARNRPLAVAVYFNWPALVNAARPWVDFGVRTAIPHLARSSGGGMKMDAAKMESILKQVHTGLEVLKVLRGVQSVTYFENNILVTHSVSFVRDLPPERRQAQ
ncbi:MAG TPA: hypothetical protein VFA18_08355 [Gemmataceae bacterium]|nr:hypothetical protein [Gemmataceae bacterium]